MLSKSWNRGNGTTGLLVSWICSADTLFRSAARTDQRLGKHPGSWLRKQLSPVLGGRLLRMQSSSTLLKSRRERQHLLQLLQSRATAVITPMKVMDSYRRWIFVAPMHCSWHALTPSLFSQVFLLVVLGLSCIEQRNLPLLVT